MKQCCKQLNIIYVNMNTSIDSLNKTLISSLNNPTMPLGLAHGKMGICIYFFVLSRYEENKEYKSVADKILDEIFERISEIQSIDVKNGLSGIGIGIDYLIKNNYTRGDINKILEDIDDILFKNLSYPQYYEKIDTFHTTHLIYYLCVRLKDQKENSDEEYLFKELIIQTVNNLYERINISFYEEPLFYTLDYPLPQLLFVLSEIYKLNFYNYRIIKIVEELSYKVLSIIPILQCNKLYLLWGIDALNKQVNNINWERHIFLLKNNINIEHILCSEIRNKNIYFNDGLASIYYLIDSLSDYFDNSEINMTKKKIVDKIMSSNAWEQLKGNQQYFEMHTGLFNGFIGTSILLKKKIAYD